MNYSPYAKNKYATNLLIFMFIFKGIREIASLSSRITTKNKNINSWQNKFCV